MGGSNWPTTSVKLVAALRRPEDFLAWERFLSEYGPVLLDFCERRGVQRADAEDIVQTVFVGVHRKIGVLAFSQDRGRFRSWLSTIALRAIWKLRYRTIARRGELLVESAELERVEAQQGQLLDEINMSVVELAVAEVRPEFDAPTWDVFSAIWFRDERPRDVAARVGRPASWVYKAKFNVLARLKCVIRRIAQELDEFGPA